MRLFVAVNLPERERAAIARATERLRGAGLPVRWTDPQSYHFTLKFLGHVAAADVRERIAAALGTVGRRHAAFALTIRGAGAFPGVRRPQVFWLGVVESDALLALARDVEALLAPLGFPTEARPFHPHLTLGRTQRGTRAAALREAEALLNDVAFETTFDVETVDLMRSHLSPRGARYECVVAAPLAA